MYWENRYRLSYVYQRQRRKSEAGTFVCLNKDPLSYHVPPSIISIRSDLFLRTLTSSSSSIILSLGGYYKLWSENTSRDLLCEHQPAPSAWHASRLLNKGHEGLPLYMLATHHKDGWTLWVIIGLGKRAYHFICQVYSSMNSYETPETSSRHGRWRRTHLATTTGRGETSSVLR